MAGVTLPWSLRRKAQRLLHQQCWNWGRDIVRKEGNLLLEYGFERRRPPAGIAGSSRYIRVYPDGEALVLWGFGLFMTKPGFGGVYINRYRFAPEWTEIETEPSSVWTPNAVPPGQRPAEPALPLALAAAMALRVADYEEWVLGRCGVGYRVEGLREWKQATRTLPPEAAPFAWGSLAGALEERLPVSRRISATAS